MVADSEDKQILNYRNAAQLKQKLMQKLMQLLMLLMQHQTIIKVQLVCPVGVVFNLIQTI
jgi:hypothetical protein